MVVKGDARWRGPEAAPRLRTYGYE